MKTYLIKQFYSNKACRILLLFLFLVGIMALYTGKNFLDHHTENIGKSAVFQKESIEKNINYHPDDLGLIVYYIKFNFVNTLPKLAALNIGMRDLNPSIQGVTIKNLEEQRYNSDFYNPATVAAGNLDFSFVLVFIFPLVIIAFCYNALSEEEEHGTWTLLCVQSGNPGKIIDLKLWIRFFAVSCIYFLLLFVATVWIKIPFTTDYFAFILSGWLYIIFWFILIRWIIAFRKSSAFNALILVLIWIGLNFIVPMCANILIQKSYPTQESLEAVMKQRDGFHNKWDEPKQPTMEKFYNAYPEFRKYRVSENNTFTWTWYYAMQHMGDLEAQQSSAEYTGKMKQRNKVTDYLGYIIPSLHTQLVESNLARTGMNNHLEYADALQEFHERKRLFFYPLIFSGQNATSIDWSPQTVAYFNSSMPVNWWKLLLPYLIMTGIFFGLSQIKYRQLC